MEAIESLLNKEEDIIWKRVEMRNLISMHKSLVIFLSVSLIFNTIISTPIFLFEEYLIPVIMAGVSLFGLNFVIIMIIIFMIKDYKQKVKRLGANKNQLEEYEEICVLTSKHWIQKNYDFSYRVDPSVLEMKGVRRVKDILFVDRSEIEYVSTHETNSYNKIKMHLDEDIDVWGGSIGVDILEKSEYLKVIDLLTEELHLEKEGFLRSKITIYEVMLKDKEQKN